MVVGPVPWERVAIMLVSETHLVQGRVKDLESYANVPGGMSP